MIGTAALGAQLNAEEFVGFDTRSFGDVVLSQNQALGVQLELSIGDYNNEPIVSYSAKSIFSQLGRSVGRLDILTDTGVFPCTAFVVGKSLLLTNYHCVPGVVGSSETRATRIDAVQFVAGYTQEGVDEGTKLFFVSPQPIDADRELDYALLRVIGDPSEDFGHLSLSDHVPEDGDPYWIIGHPLGEAQRISREKCRASTPALSSEKLLHTCDTLPGNSGSPVIDTSLRAVIGLHHAGSRRNSVNFAIPMNLILEHSETLAALKPDNPGRTPSAGPVPNVNTAANPADSNLVSKLFEEIAELGFRLGKEEEARASDLASIAELKAELAAAQNEQSDEEAARLAEQAAAEALRQRLAGLETRLTDAETRRLAEAAAAEKLREQLAGVSERLSDEEAARLSEAAAAEALRERLKNADTELTAMTLALEAERKEAEETLTLLAAARAAQSDLDDRLAEALLAMSTLEGTLQDREAALAQALAEVESLQGSVGDEAELRQRLASALAAATQAEAAIKQALTREEALNVLLANAETELAEKDTASAENARREELLNRQVAELRSQLGNLQELLDAALEADEAAQVEIQALGSQLNFALAKVAAEQRARANLEETERKLLEQETKQLETYRSEFFGRIRQLLQNRESVRVEGDRFVFSSEILFQIGDVSLSQEGKAQIARVAAILQDVAVDIPPEIDWVVRIDGHTDDAPISSGGRYRNNWELSQGRALSVVQYLIDDLGFPPDRLAATGFGEYQPINPADSAIARAQNSAH